MSFAFIDSNEGSYSREILIAGYVRKVYCNIYIPQDIMRLFNEYSKDYITWKISHEQFLKFQNKAEQVDDWNYEVLLGPVLNIKGFEFECNIASVSRAEFIQFQIRLKSTNKYQVNVDNIRSIIAYYEVNCAETKSSEKDTKILHEVGDEMSWPMYNMRVTECIHLQSFTFHVYVDIFKVHFKRNPILKQKKHKNSAQLSFDLYKYQSLAISMNKDIHYRPIRMFNKIKYSWLISGDLLNEFQHSQFGKYWYSPNFGLNGQEINGDNFAWCLYCAPHGYNHSMNNKVYIGIVLLNLPPKIKKIEINFTMQCQIPNGHLIQYEQIGKIMHYRDNCAAWPGSDRLTIKDLQNIYQLSEEMTIMIQIEIVRVVSDRGLEIDANDWEFFGIYKKSIWPKTDLTKSFSWLQYLQYR